MDQTKGTNAIKITRTADTYQYFHFNMPIGVGTYEVSWNETYGGGTTGLTVTPDTGAVSLRVYVGGTAGTDGISSGETNETTNAWIHRKFTFSGTNDSSTFFMVTRNLESAAGHVYVSDFEVRPINPPKVNQS